MSPLAYLVPAYATAPALMYVGLLMLSNVAKVDFNDFVDAMSGLLTAVIIVLTCNIVTGIMIGFASLVVGRLFAGNGASSTSAPSLLLSRWWRFTPVAGRSDCTTGRAAARPEFFTIFPPGARVADNLHRSLFYTLALNQ